MNIIIKIFFFLCLILTESAISQSGWIDMSIGTSDYTGVFFATPVSCYAIRSDGFVLKTTNQGGYWVSINTNSPILRTGSFANSMLGAIWGIAPKLTTDGGETWNNMTNEIMASVVDIYFVKNSLGFTAGIDAPFPDYYGVVSKTTNGGQNWIEILRRAGLQFQEIIIQDENNLKVLEASGIESTSNGGINWSYNDQLFIDIPFICAQSMTDPFRNVFYVAGYISGDRAVVAKTTNGGNFWYTSFQTNSKSRLNKIQFIDDSVGYAVGDTGLIIKTSNRGISWMIQNSKTTKDLIGLSFINEDTGFVVGDNGLILKTTNGGLSSVNNQSETLIKEFKLSQNYPNPFNPETTIEFEFTSAMPSFVRLFVYDVLGKRSLELIQDKKKSGAYSVKFDGRNLSSGIYLYSLVINGVVLETKRMVLLK